MNATLWRALMLAAVAVIGSPAPVRATYQERDVIQFKGDRHWMLERPLSDLLYALPEELEFDWPRTSNWKGYTARWEVKDGVLYLVSFEAKRDGKEVPLETILPGRSLSVRADWFSRRVHIPVGDPIVGNNDSGYGNTYERVIVLDVHKGKVLKEVELKNFRIESFSRVRETELAKHCLWVFPRLEMGTVISTSQPVVSRKMCSITVPPIMLLRTPVWPTESNEPPYSPLRAMLRAEAKIRDLGAPVSRYSWEMTRASIKLWSGDRYYYQFDYRARPLSPFATREDHWLQLLVLMDGTVPEPLILDIGDLVHARRAGAFDVESVRWGADPSKWETPYLGTPWSNLSWRSRLSLLASIAAAPKLVYELDKLEIYSNGVWADYSVSNWSDRLEYYRTDYLNVPILNAGLWDAAGEKWSVRRRKEEIGTGNPQKLTAIEARQTIRYRALISRQQVWQLEPFGILKNREPGKPKVLEYFINAWPSASTNLTEGKDSEVQVFAFGYGRVQVQWFDKPYPSGWPVQTRYYGSKAEK